MKRPRIISNLAVSLDGRIAPPGEELHYLGSALDRSKMRGLRNKVPTILVGATTLRQFRRPMLGTDHHQVSRNLILSTNLAKISPRWPFFQDERLIRVLFVSKLPAHSLREEFEKTSTPVLLPKGKPAALGICHWLLKNKISELLVEGGGEVIWEFLRADLLDEMYLTLTPWLIGGHRAPSLVGGKGFSANALKRLKLKSVRRVKDELFLHYIRGNP